MNTSSILVGAFAALLSTTAATAQNYGNRYNLARYPNAAATQHSTQGTAVASRAIDGNRSGNNANCCLSTPYVSTPSCSSTTNAAGAWWQVAMPSGPNLTFPVKEVMIWNRADCCADRLSNFRVELIKGTTTVFSQTYYTNGGSVPPGGCHRIVLPGTTPMSAGVDIDICRISRVGPSPSGENYLALAEVELWSDFYGYRDVNVAPYGTLTSSQVDSGSAPLSVVTDGIVDGYQPAGHAFWTFSFPGSWVRLDLRRRSYLTSVRLFNRNDDQMERMSNYQVVIYDGATAVGGGVPQTAALGPSGFSVSPFTLNTWATAILVRSAGAGLTLEHIVQLSELEVWAMDYNLGIHGEVVEWGNACERAGGPGPRTRVQAGQEPRLSTTYSVQIENPMPLAPGVYGSLLVSGFTDTQVFVGLPGTPGCWQLVNNDLLSFATSATNTVAFPFTIPNNVSLLAHCLYHQALLFDSTTPYVAGIVLGNGLRTTIGL